MIHSDAFVLEIISSFFVKIIIEESQMPAFGQHLGEVCQLGSVIFLKGTLGMGKTTLSRALVQGLGWQGKVKSPTYTLVEQYDLANAVVFHFDLYRLADPEELEFMGIRDFDAQRGLWLVEWPEKGAGLLPPADLEIELDECESADARQVTISAHSSRGESQLQSLRNRLPEAI
jgi:tRNA threonylcarbamoyladenosine biosynthesis protein TsaE